MSEQVSAPAESAKPENLSLDERVAQALANRTDAQDHVEEVVAEPDAVQAVAPETPAEPEPPQPGAWRKVILDDVDHGFFKGKPAEQLYNSYRESESAKQKAERERNEARMELDKLRREREADDAVRRVMPQPAAEPQKKEDPRDAEIDRLWFENPTEARRLMNEKAHEEQERIAEEKFNRLYESRESEKTEKTRQKSANDAATVAAQQLMDELKLSPEDAVKAVYATFGYVKMHEAEIPDVWANPEVYIHYAREIRRLYGGSQPPAAEMPAPAPPANIPMPPSQPKQPPGATKPAPIAAPPEVKPSALSPENRRVREMLGGPSLVARGERRKRA